MPGSNSGRTPAGDAFSRFAFQVLRLSALLTTAGDELSRPAGQTSARWQVLAVIEHGPAPVAQVARVLGLARQSVQRIADVLVAEGLAAYEDNPEHRRAKLLRLTDPGRSALTMIQAAQRSWADAIGAGLGEERLHAASEVLAAAMDAVAAAPPLSAAQ